MTADTFWKELEEIYRDQLDDDWSEEGAVAVEGLIAELVETKASTYCGTLGNQCFAVLAKFAKKRFMGWVTRSGQNTDVMGIFHIECNEAEADEIEELVGKSGGSLRTNGDSFRKGFQEFEIE
jgi:hypothetical protein